MFSRSITDDSRSVNDTARVVRMTTIIVNDTPSCGVTYGSHSDNSSGVIYAPRVISYALREHLM